jgi:hypothetical protein
MMDNINNKNNKIKVYASAGRCGEISPAAFFRDLKWRDVGTSAVLAMGWL